MPAAIPFITQANASQIAKHGWEVRRRKALQSIRQQQALLTDSRAREVLELVQAQIDETCAVLNDKHGLCDKCGRGGIDGKTRAQLLGALDRLLERERVWSQRPGPANLKPEPRRQQHRPWAEPQEAGPVLLPKPEPASTQGAEPQKPGA